MTVVTLRPDSTVSNTGSLTGAATAHAATNDNSDSSYDAITFDTVELSVDTLSPTAGALLKTLAIRVRVANIGGASRTLWTRFYNNGTDNITSDPAAVVTWSVPTTVTGDTKQLPANDLAGNPITVASINAGHVRLHDSSAGGGTGVNIYEVYVDVTYVTIPVVSADAPSGTVSDTNLPTVEWSNTLDSDGGAQTTFEVKVYTDAEYGAGGFDPDTTTPTATSGITTSTVGSWQLDETLANDTYRAYVRVAQTVNGTVHWSDWDFAQFDVSVTLPGTPTISTTTITGGIEAEVAEASGSATTDRLELQRSSDGGTTWEPVRNTTGDDGLILLPYVAATGTYSSSANATSHAIPYPAPGDGILAGDMLIAFAAIDGSNPMSWPADWEELRDEVSGTGQVRASVAWKRATGNESGTFTLTTSSEGGGVRVLCIRDAHPTQKPVVPAGAGGTGANQQPPGGSVDWDPEYTLWIAAIMNNGNVAVTAGPSGYEGFGNTRWANVDGAGVATAYDRVLANAEQPGAFTHAAAEALTYTVAVRGQTPTLDISDYEVPNGVATSHRVRSLHDYSGVFAASAWASDSATWTDSSWWFKHPNQPDLNTTVTIRSQPGYTRAGRQGVFQALGATTAVVVQDTRAPKTGTVTLRTDTLTALADLDALLDENATLLLQSPANGGGPEYIRVLGHEEQRVIDHTIGGERRWQILEFVHVARPPGEVVAWP